MAGVNNCYFLKYSFTFQALEEQVIAGRTKAIGVSNFNKRQIEKIWQSARIKPACNQIELYPYLQQPELVKYCQDKKIVVVAYSSLGSSLNSAMEKAGRE